MKTAKDTIITSDVEILRAAEPFGGFASNIGVSLFTKNSGYL